MGMLVMDQKKERGASIWWLVGVGILACVVVASAMCGDWGRTDGMYWVPGVETLFSGLAFAGLIYTIWLQKHELILQRKELSLTRDVMEDQRQQLENQSETMNLERFENTFFKLAASFEQARSSLLACSAENSYLLDGDPFKTFLRQFEFEFYFEFYFDYLTSRRGFDEIKSVLVKHFKQQFDQKDNLVLKAYCLHLCNLMEFTKNAAIEDKRFYVNLYVRDFSLYGLSFLYYYGMYEYDHGEKSFIEIANQLSLFRRLNMDSIHTKPDLINSYLPSAFGRDRAFDVDTSCELKQLYGG